MADHDSLIDELCRSAVPVRGLAPPILRALALVAIALPSGLAATLFMHPYHPNWSAPGMAWPMAEIALLMTSGVVSLILAVYGSVPGRSLHRLGGWILCGLAAWLLVSAGNILISPRALGGPGEGSFCYPFLLLAGSPMIVLTIFALRQTRSLHPYRTLAIAGVGVASLSLGLLGFCHPADLHLVDFGAHLAGAASLLLLTILAGKRWISV